MLLEFKFFFAETPLCFTFTLTLVNWSPLLIGIGSSATYETLCGHSSVKNDRKHDRKIKTVVESTSGLNGRRRWFSNVLWSLEHQSILCCFSVGHSLFSLPRTHPSNLTHPPPVKGECVCVSPGSLANSVSLVTFDLSPPTLSSLLCGTFVVFTFTFWKQKIWILVDIFTSRPRWLFTLRKNLVFFFFYVFCLSSSFVWSDLSLCVTQVPEPE